jgi:hypothetical protein
MQALAQVVTRHRHQAQRTTATIIETGGDLDRILSGCATYRLT